MLLQLDDTITEAGHAMKRITIRIDEALYAKLAALAEEEHRSLNAQLIVLIEEATKEQSDNRS